MLICTLSSEPPCAAGAEIKVSKPMEDKNPLVLGRLGRNPDVPTVTFYGHYDVQPAMEREWATDPFEIAAIDGYLYGRGTSDNKVSRPRGLLPLDTVMIVLLSMIVFCAMS